MIKPNNSKENKVLNRNNVLKLLMLYAPLSRVELARRSGLSKMTLTNIVNEFLEEGLVAEGEKGKTATCGRKPIALSLSGQGFCAIGIYLSRSGVSGCVLSASGTVLAIRRIPFSRQEDSHSPAEKIRNLAGALVKCAQGRKIWGIGVGSIGPVDPQNGVVLNPPDFYGIQNLEVKQILSKQYPFPVYLDNDMNAAAVAEKYFGAAKDQNDFIYVGVTNGIGAGIFSGGKLLAGSAGQAGELGHIAVELDGKPCPCGSRGCLELYADIRHTVEAFRAAAAAGAKTSVANPEDAGYRELAAALRAGDSLSKTVIAEQCRYLSAGITNIINIFDPECVFLGHELAFVGEFAVRTISEGVNSRILARGFRQIPVRFSSFGEHAPLIGSAAQVFDRILSEGENRSRYHD